MTTIIDTINDALFKHREVLKTLNEEQEELLLKLCSNRQTSGHIKNTVAKLESELKSLYESTYGQKSGCDTQGPAAFINSGLGAQSLEKRRD